MRFLVVNQPAKANIFGQEYQLKPFDPIINNIEDILVTDNFSARELLSRHQNVLSEIRVSSENLKGFPKMVNRLSDIGDGGKILIMRNGGIGDHVLFLPALRIYREMFPADCEIWLATQKEKHPLFYNNRNIERLYSLPLRLDTLMEVNYLVDFSSRNDWYDLKHMHMTDCYLNFLGIDYRTLTCKKPEMAWSRNRSSGISNLFEQARQSHPNKLLVMMNWKASNRLRDLPPEKLLFLVDKIKDVLFVVAQSKVCQDVSRLLCGHGNNVFNCSAEMGSLEDYIAAIANCDAVLSTDTATGHLAEALGKPSLVIYGPTRDDLWIRYHHHVYPVRAEYSGKTCQSPCGLTKNIKDGCPEAVLSGCSFSPCLLSISEEKIELAFTEFIRGKHPLKIGGNPMAQPSISACMIVKNEERLLPGCLKSIKDHVDEIVIVDTGSTDQTVAIAESFGARIFHHPWEHDFSKHRNQSLGYAQGDWLLIIDADEELLRGSGEEIRKAIQATGDHDGITAVVECPFNRGTSVGRTNSIRLVKNGRGIRYEGRVHNFLVGVKKAMCAPIHLFHHGYNLDKAAMSAKFERTAGLLKKEIEERPDHPRAHHFLAAAYLSENMFSDAAKEAQCAVRLYEKGNMEPHNYLWSLYIASAAYFEMGDMQQAQEMAAKGVAISRYHMDAYYMTALIAYARHEEKPFEASFGCYLQLKDLLAKDPAVFGAMVHNTFESEWLLRVYRAHFLIERLEMDRADREIDIARSLCPNRLLFHKKLGILYGAVGKLQLAEEELGKAFEICPEDVETVVGLADICEKTSRIAQQVVWLEKLADLDPGCVAGKFSLGLVYMRLGRLRQAVGIFKDIQAMAPEDQEARLNEALCLRGMGEYARSIEVTNGVVPVTEEQRLAVLSNLAHCYRLSGKRPMALECFSIITEVAPEAVEPGVYLSLLLLEEGDIEGCVLQCDRLMSILDMREYVTLECIEDLGSRFVKIGAALAIDRGEKELAEICFQVARMTGRETAEVVAGVGAELIRSNELAAGVRFIEQAVTEAPYNEKVRSEAKCAAEALESLVANPS